MKVSDWLHAPAALPSQKESLQPKFQEASGPRAGLMLYGVHNLSSSSAGFCLVYSAILKMEAICSQNYTARPSRNSFPTAHRTECVRIQRQTGERLFRKTVTVCRGSHMIPIHRGVFRSGTAAEA
jgi:hypothetical protein